MLYFAVFVARDVNDEEIRFGACMIAERLKRTPSVNGGGFIISVL